MGKTDFFWKRAFISARQILSRPIGGGGKALPEYKPSEDAVRVATVSTVPVGSAVDSYGVRGVDTVAKPVKRQLWGREFDLADEGFSEDQVAVVVGNLINKCRDMEDQQKYHLSLSAVTERAAMEADKAAASIKARARGEAEAEAAKIIAEAKRMTLEIMAEAKKAAADATRQQVADILQSAQKQAALIELQSKQQAKRFQISNRETIEDDLKEEIKECYNRLLSEVHNVMESGRRLEQEWGGKTAQLRMNEVFELPGYNDSQVNPTLKGSDKTPLTVDDIIREINAGQEIYGSDHASGSRTVYTRG